MANKIISNLTPKTSPAAADVLAIEDTEATKKIDYNALADAILNKITSKTYSVAGSTQTLISAIDALNSNLTSIVLPQASVSSNADIYAIYDALGNATSFRRRLIATTAFDVLASGRAYILEGYKNSDNYGYLYLYSYGTPQGSVYSNLKSNGSWSGWQLIPTRAELDSLNNSLALESAIPTAYDGRVEQGSTTDADLTRCYRSGHVRALSVFVSVKKELTSSQTSLLVLPSGYIPSKNVYGLIFDVSKNRTFVCQVATSGNFNVYHDGLFSVGDRLYANIVFMV